MVESFLIAHREFMSSLDSSISQLEPVIKEAAGFVIECSGEWCSATEASIDELAKFIYSISEPRWLSDKDSQVIHDMRNRVHDLYGKYKGVGARSANA
jgi:hypothetical protein